MELGLGGREPGTRESGERGEAPRETSSDVPRSRWHVVLEGELLGPLSSDELVDALRARTGVADTPVWREGDDAWAPLREIPELVAAMRAAKGPPSLRPPVRAASVPVPAVPRAVLSDEGAPSGLVNLQALVAAASRPPAPSIEIVPVSIPAPTTMAPAVRARPRGEVFAAGALVGACFVGVVAVASWSVPGTASEAPVVRAHESVVAPPELVAAQPPTAAFVAAREPAPVIAEAPTAAPVLEAPPVERVEIAAVTIAAAPPVAIEPEVIEEPVAEAEVAAPEEAPAEELAELEAAPTELEEAPVAETELATAAEEPAAEAAPSASLDSLIEAAVGREEEAAPAASERETDSLPDAPSRDEVDRVLARLEPAVTSCGEIGHGIAVVRITTSGASGRVTSAVVEGALRGTPAGSCVARAVRTATFPRFARESFTVVYPFRI